MGTGQIIIVVSPRGCQEFKQANAHDVLSLQPGSAHMLIIIIFVVAVVVITVSGSASV